MSSWAPVFYIGPLASLRGDYGRPDHGGGRLTICRMAALYGCLRYHDTIVHENGHIGHGATMHMALRVVGRDIRVGMNSVIMDAQ